MEKQSDTVYQPGDRPPKEDRDAFLVQIYPSGPSMGKLISLTRTATTLGRGEDAAIQVLDQSVSRVHARIEPTDVGFAVCDLHSTNGTFVNDDQSRKSEPIPLHDGDYLRLGNCIFRFLASGNVEADYHEEIYRLTIIDALTQTYNKRYLMDFLDREVTRTARHGRPLSLLMMDVDHFRHVNDDLGHLGGDFALHELAQGIHKTIRREDLFARYGGEEFVLVLVETDHQQALGAAERIRSLVERQPFEFDGHQFNLTISIGVAHCPTDGSATVKELLSRADHNLYEAKNKGRNCVVG